MSNSENKKRSTFNILGLELDVRVTVITIATTLLIMIDYYNRFLPTSTAAEALRGKAIERFFYYLVIPLIIIVVFFRDRPSEYGFRIGDWRQGLKWTVIVCAIAMPILYFTARTPAMIEYYGRVEREPLEVILTSGVDLIGWEFMFRGFIQFGIMPVVGPIAVVLQAVPFALGHLGKPQLETLSTIFGGILFGWVAWRGGSFVYAFLIHWFINVFVFLVAASAAN